MNIFNQKLDSNEFLSSLDKYGFVNVRNFFDKDIINRVSNEIEIIFSNRFDSSKVSINRNKAKSHLREYQNSPYNNSNNILSTSLLGKSDFVDSFMKELFESDYFNNICQRIVGDNFRIYTCSARKISSNAKSLSLHQDGFGMVTVTIPLNDVTDKSGTTLFVPKSHKYSFSVLNKLFSIPLFLFKFLCVKYIANVGDLGFFYNKTFHAALKGEDSTIIIISLVSEEGVVFQPWLLPKNTNYGNLFAASVGKKLVYKLSSNNQIVINGKKSFTTQIPIDDSLDQPLSIALKKGFDGYKMEVLESLYYLPIQQRYRMIDRVILNEKITLKSITISIYLNVFIFLFSTLKFFKLILQKKFNFLR